ncbi:MAG: radical SAM protein [Candidatus Lokiarchaeota archaeon]|nr:radical SAM protein [Candidatus Lokiarchaeota archaeon]
MLLLDLKILISDILATGKGLKSFTRDFIGAGPRTVAGILKKYGIKSEISLFNESNSKKMKDFDILMISAMSMDAQACKILIKNWRAIKDGNYNPIILGGPIVCSSDHLIKNLNFDLGLIGEAELGIEKLINKKILNNFEKNQDILKEIDGIIFKKDNILKINPITSYLDKKTFNSFLPSTSHVKYYPNYFIARVYVECVRGCSNFNRTKLKLIDGRKCNNCNICEEKPNDRLNCPKKIPPGCGYCSVPSVYGPSKSKTKQNILSDIRGLIKEGVRKIVLGGPDFLDYERESLIDSDWLMNPINPRSNVKAIEDLLAEIYSIPEINQKKVFVAIENIKPNLFTEEIAEIISKYLPNTYLSIGCETGSPKLAELIGRPSLPKDALNAVKIAKRNGIKVHAYFIHNLPGQDKIAALKTKELMINLQKLDADKITIYRFKALPSSAFQDFNSKESIYSKKLKKLAIKINREQKQKYLGKKFRIFISERHFTDPSIGIGVFLTEGPSVLVPNAGQLVGNEVDVIIKRIVSDKLIEGSIVI